MPLSSVVLDHVAVAVADLEGAVTQWLARGAVPVAGGLEGGFRTEQLRFSNGAKLELIGPDQSGGGSSFIDGFLDRFGAGRIHHVTVKVPDSIPRAVATLAADGLTAVDVNTSDDFWHEAFLGPKQVGGLIAQVAWQDGDDAAYAVRMGRPAPSAPNPDAPSLDLVRLQHDDLGTAATVWGSLGAGIHAIDGGGFIATWGDSPLAIEVTMGDTAGPLGLVMEGLPPADRSASGPTLLSR